MTATSLRSVVLDLWEALDGSRASAPERFRVADTPVTSSTGPLAVASDHSGSRHLLVPISADRVVRGGLDGPALVLRKRTLVDGNGRRTFADLSCLRSDLDDVFTGLCADVLRSVESDPHDPVKVLYSRLDRWRALFRTVGRPLGTEQQAGLFAELTVLLRLLRKDPSAHRTWRGPERYRHDFAGADRAVEVKASTTSEGRRIRVHGLDQLEAPPGGLQLYWIRLESVTTAVPNLNGLVDDALKLCDDEGELRNRLSAAGYHDADRSHYDRSSFVVAEERRYDVGPDFPRLTAGDLLDAGLPINVMDVHYTCDLSNEPPLPISEDRAEQHLVAMLGER